jgi:hypothetical protein
MITALFGHIQGQNREGAIRIPGFQTYRVRRHAAGETLDSETAHEIMDALYKLRAIYCDEKVQHVLPNRRASVNELQDAVNAQCLVDHYGFDVASAMKAVTGKPLRVEPDSARLTMRTRCEAAALRGVTWDMNVIAKAVMERKPKNRRA